MANFKLLVEDTDEEFEISQDDIHIYAKQIGIDVSKEPHLMWIAEEGLSAKVPKPWLICSDENDRVFYYNPQTSKASWHHPLDIHYANLVSEERSKSKSLNSASSDYGFESKLSSLADAPPLSSNGRNSPLSFKSKRKDGGLLGKRFEFGNIENRRGTQLAPVRLNNLKMPTASVPKSSGSMSFMPKGSSFTKNIKRVKEEKHFSSQNEEEFDYENPVLDDSNESINSDDDSKYSYEETDDEKQILGHEPFDMMEASQLSPRHSADESPNALDINSLVQFGTNVPPKLDSSLQRKNVQSIYNKENSPSLSLRKIGQPTFLKPLTSVTKKKTANKNSKVNKKVKSKNVAEVDAFLDERISSVNDEQQVMLDQIQKEWFAMQNDFEKKEKEKQEENLKDSTKNSQEEEMKLKKDGLEKIEKIKSDLRKKIEEEEHMAELSLQSFKESNKQRMSEEEKKIQEQLDILSESLKTEIRRMEEKNALELAQRKKELEESTLKELSSLKNTLECNKKNIEKAHEIDISKLEEAHAGRIKELRSANEKEEHEIFSSVSHEESAKEEREKLQNLIREETKKYQDLLKEKESAMNEISCEKNSLKELKKQTNKAQSTLEELQDEIEKTENDLDLLRTEKSALITELNIIKEEISNQKINLSSLEQKLNTTNETVNCSKELSEIGINTDTSFSDFICKAVQVSVSCCDTSSQVENVSHSMLDAMCQTSVTQTTANKSCQTILVPSINDKNEENSNKNRVSLDPGAVLDKNLEDAFSGLSTKLNSRINVIENQIKLLQENLSRPVVQQSFDSSQDFMQNQYSKLKNVSATEIRTLKPTLLTNSSMPCEQFSSNVPVTSQNMCKCEIGDPESCSILQDVKNSVYRLNDILCTSFEPPVRNCAVYHSSQPVNNYSSPFENFYVELRQIQEKKRLVDLKQKWEGSALQFTKDSRSNLKDVKTCGKLNHTKSPYHLVHSDTYSHTISEDPLVQARSIILREKARAFKEQQSLESSVSHMFSSKSSPECLQSSNTGFMPAYNVPSSEQTLFSFEVDPESDFNMWMTRLNALQLRIRSHKIF